MEAGAPLRSRRLLLRTGGRDQVDDLARDFAWDLVAIRDDDATGFGAVWQVDDLATFHYAVDVGSGEPCCLLRYLEWPELRDVLATFAATDPDSQIRQEARLILGAFDQAGI